jgi:hypothetical protein
LLDRKFSTLLFVSGSRRRPFPRSSEVWLNSDRFVFPFFYYSVCLRNHDDIGHNQNSRIQGETA